MNTTKPLSIHYLNYMQFEGNISRHLQLEFKKSRPDAAIERPGNKREYDCLTMETDNNTLET